MPASDEPDDTRLAGRMPRRQVDEAVAAAAGAWRTQAEAGGEGDSAVEPSDGSESDERIDADELDAVTRLMGFLRSDEET